MGFIKNLLARFSGGPKADVETMRGLPPLQTDAEQSASRTRMEAEMAGQKERRDNAAPKDGDEPGNKPNLSESRASALAKIDRAIAGSEAPKSANPD